MKQVEQWFSILQRKRLRISDFSGLDHLAERLHAFVAEWNTSAHPFNWSSKSEALVMAKCSLTSPTLGHRDLDSFLGGCTQVTLVQQPDQDQTMDRPNERAGGHHEQQQH